MVSSLERSISSAATELPATPEDEAPWRVYLVMPSYVPYRETSDPSNLLLFPEVRFRIV